MNLRQVVFWLIASIGVAHTCSAYAQQVQIKGPKSATAQFSGSTYGPINSNDTLWRIANRYRQNKNLTIYQVMQAIYELNPDAFEQGNVNLLRDGAILNLPSERYVARIDPNEARLRAERDDANFQPAADGSGAKVIATPAATVASKEDLSQTKADLEDKLSAIDDEQNRQFMAIRQQFAESIESVQGILTENQKLYERLETVNTEIDQLRNNVEVDIPEQFERILALQNEMLAISLEAEARRKAEMEKSSFAWLSDPITIIVATVILSLSFIGGLAYWLIARRRTSPLSDEAALQAAVAPIVEQNSEMDDLADALADELSGELSEEDDNDLFGEDDLLDDVLSEELQESLDEALDEELESFDDLGDEMLVADADQDESQGDDLFEDGESVLAQDDLDNLFDEDDDDLLAAIDEESIDLSETDELDADALDESDAELDSLLDEDDLDDLLDEAIPQEEEVENEPEPEVVDLENEPELPAEAVSAVVDDEGEKPEISIDELLEEPQADVPASIELDDSEALSEETLQQLDQEIAAQNQEIDKVTDDLLNEIEQLEQMGEFLDDDDASEETQPEVTDPQMGIQELDSLSDDIDDAELQDDLSDELLAELGVDNDLEQPVDEAESGANDLADELLAELDAEDSDQQAAQEVFEEPDVAVQESEGQVDDIAEELLAELGVDGQADETTDESTQQQQDATAGSDALEDELSVDELLDSIEPVQEVQEVQAEDLAPELEEAEALAETEPQVEAETEAEAEPEVEAETEAQAEPEVEAEIEEQAEPQAEAVIEAEPETELEAEAEPEVEAEAESEAEVEAEAEVEPQVEAEAESEAEVEAETEAEAEPEVEAETEAQAEPEVEAEIEAEAEPQVEAEAEAEVEAEIEVQAEPELEPEAEQEQSADTELTGESVDELLAELDELEEEPVAETAEVDELPSLDTSAPLDEADFDEAAEQDLDIPSIEEDQFEQALQEFEEGDDAPSSTQDIEPEAVDAKSQPDAEHELSVQELDEIIPGLDEIGSLDEIDDSELDAALDSFDFEDTIDNDEVPASEEPAAKTEATESSSELEDMPGLGEWLSDEQETEDLQEIENASFDEILQSIDGDADVPAPTPEQDALLDNPDLDLEALLDEQSDDDLSPDLVEEIVELPEEDFLDVDALLNESIEAESDPLTEQDLNLDVSLGDYAGAVDDADLIDVDGDQGIGAKLDLARAYIEIDDSSAAKALLDEVVASGDEVQIAEAKAVLAELKGK